MSRYEKKSGWYGEKLKGITHAGSEDHWIRRLLTMALAGNGAALVIFLNFLKGQNYQTTSENLRDNVDVLILFLFGVLVIGAATFAGAWESSVRKKRDLDFQSWKEHDYLNDESEPRSIEEVFDTKYPKYQLHSRRAWVALYGSLAMSIACFVFGITLVGYDIAL